VDVGPVDQERAHRVMRDASPVRVAAIQHDIVWESPPENYERLAPRVEAAARDGATFVVLSEMFASGFSMRTDLIAESVDGPSVQFLRDLASRHRVHVGGSIAIRDGARVFNTFVVASPDATLVSYRKLHPFSYGREHEHYAAGDALVVTTIHDVRVALFVCYDLRFANQFWTLAPDVDAYVVTANWPSARRHHWRSLLVARAIENQAYVVGCNRVGDAPKLHYAGDTMIVDPLGETIAGAADDAEDVAVADITTQRVREVREQYPFLPDRRETLPPR
jgi:predicted amidohydrolase